MPDDALHFGGEKQERDASRLLPTAFLSESECEALAHEVAARVRIYNPVQLLTGVSFPSLLLHPTDSHPAMIEYLQHLILTHPPAAVPADANEEVVNQLFADVKNIFGAVSFARAFEGRPDDPRSELQDSLVRDALFIRGKSYVVHQFDLLGRLLSSIDDWLLAHMEVSADDFLRTVRYLFEAINDKANAVITEMREVTERPENGSFGMVVEHGIFLLSPPDEGIERVLRLLSAAPGSQPEPSSLLPGHEWAASRDYPVLHYQGDYYCFNPQPVAEELPRLVSMWIAHHDKPFFDRRYVHLREALLTEMAIESLVSVFPGADHGKNLYYRADGSDRAETDGVVLYDDVAIVIEAKAGALSFPARQGRARRIERDFASLVGKAFSQARRAADFILQHPAGSFTDERGRVALDLANRDIRKVYLLNPVLDSMDAFAIELADARESGLLPADQDWPWCAFINDLRLVADILDTPSVFLLYMDRRLRFNVHSHWFRVHDELDLLDYFLHNGLFLEKKPVKDADFVQWQADSRELDQYYAAKAMGLALPEKPRPPFLPEITALVERIENSDTHGRTALAMEILGLGEASHRRILQGLSILPERLIQRHLPQSATFIRDRVGVSLWFTEGLTSDVEERLRFEDACNKHDRKADEWISGVFELVSGEPKLVKVFRDTEPWMENQGMDRTVQILRDTKFEIRAGDSKPGRNDLCPCGSGRKFKKCHGDSRIPRSGA